MKTLLLLLICQLSFGQFRFVDTEFFTARLSVDPYASFKEGGINFVSEIEYVGPIYVKVGVESFDVLRGSYRDMHAGLGLSFTSGYFEKVRYYAGVRAAKVHRGSYGAYRLNYGLEAGIDLDIADNWSLGYRATFDKRHDQEIYRWSPEAKLSSFATLSYKWHYKGRR